MPSKAPSHRTIFAYYFSTTSHILGADPNRKTIMQLANSSKISS